MSDPTADVLGVPQRASTRTSDTGDRVPRLTVWHAETIERTPQAVPACLTTIMDWIRSYVVRPHASLGRSGDVCPFVAPSIKLHALWMTAAEGNQDEAQLKTTLEAALECYSSLEPAGGAGAELKILIVVLGDLADKSCGALIDRVHYAMKPAVVDRGLMLGEFYPESLSPGVHNPRFYPLRSPIPLFVVRRMVPGDLVFLNKPSDPPDRRQQFISAYLKTFAGRLSSEWALADTAVARVPAADPPL